MKDDERETHGLQTKEVLLQGEYSPGSIDATRNGRVSNKVTVEWELVRREDDLIEFTASGTVWNSRGTDIESGGQIIDRIAEWFPNDERIQRLHAVWEEFHHNGMQAGTPEQEQYLRENGLDEASFDEQVEALKDAGLYEVSVPDGLECTGSFPEAVQDGERGYRYGERHVHRKQWVEASLPDDDIYEVIESGFTTPLPDDFPPEWNPDESSNPTEPSDSQSMGMS